MINNRLWLSRILIGAVLFFNLQCAAGVPGQPGSAYMAGFGLSGEAGAGMLRGMGLLFVMWNVPYAFACYHPVKYRVSLIEAILMQAIGLLGETWILFSTDYQNPLITSTVLRFIVFDGGGLVLLLLAFLLYQSQENPLRNPLNTKTNSSCLNAFRKAQRDLRRAAAVHVFLDDAFVHLQRLQDGVGGAHQQFCRNRRN